MRVCDICKTKPASYNRTAIIQNDGVAKELDPLFLYPLKRISGMI